MWQCGNMKILLCLKIGLRRAIWKTGEQHYYSRRVRRLPTGRQVSPKDSFWRATMLKRTIEDGS